METKVDGREIQAGKLKHRRWMFHGLGKKERWKQLSFCTFSKVMICKTGPEVKTRTMKNDIFIQSNPWKSFLG